MLPAYVIHAKSLPERKGHIQRELDRAGIPFEWVLDPTSLFDAIEEHRCSLAWLPNFAFHHLCNTAPAAKR